MENLKYFARKPIAAHILLSGRFLVIVLLFYWLTKYSVWCIHGNFTAEYAWSVADRTGRVTPKHYQSWQLETLRIEFSHKVLFIENCGA
jgi:hypothetical protein